MSYDRIWIQQSESRDGWLELRKAERQGLEDLSCKEFRRLYGKGNFVALVHGKNFIFDELFLFEGSPEAKAFYEEGYRQWESFADDSGEGCGFQEVSLYKDGRQIATKNSSPTHFSEACHE